MRRRHHLRCAPRGASLLEAVDVTESPADGRHWLRRHHTMPCEYGVPTPLSRWPSCVASLPEAVDTNQAPAGRSSRHTDPVTGGAWSLRCTGGRAAGYPDPDPVTFGVNTACFFFEGAK